MSWLRLWCGCVCFEAAECHILLYCAMFLFFKQIRFILGHSGKWQPQHRKQVQSALLPFFIRCDHRILESNENHSLGKFLFLSFQQDPIYFLQFNSITYALKLICMQSAFVTPHKEGQNYETWLCCVTAQDVSCFIVGFLVWNIPRRETAVYLYSH